MYKVKTNSAYKTHNKIKLPRFSQKVCVNYGRNTVPEGMLVLNPPDKVVNARNKLIMKEAFKVEGVSSPPFTVEKPTKFPVLLKKFFRCRGRGTKLIESEEQLPSMINGRWYYERFLRCHKEYRVHVVGNRTHTDVKVLKDGFERTWLKNHANGYRNIKANPEKLPLKVVEQAVKAVRCLSLDFGAVDIGYNTRLDKVRVWEVNTAPGLRTVTTNFYIDALTELILEKFNVEVEGGAENTRD
jgi:glutathione synthase/RimK-type ligase-like ATP-grasp enzyme